MKKTFLLFLLTIFCFVASAQQFIKTFGDPSCGTVVRTLPTNDNGWVVFTMDSMRMTKFDNCGIPQWSKQYHVPNTEQGLYDIIRTSDGGFAFLTRMELDSSFAALVTKIDVLGNISWCKSYEDPTNDYSMFPYTISEDQQGNLIIFCGSLYHIANNAAYNVIIKINSDGILLSTKFYTQGGTWGGAIVTSDNGVLFRTGNMIIKTHNNGNIQWSTSFSGEYYFLAPLEVIDGYILTGQKGSLVVFYKFDLNGQQLWGGMKTSNLLGTPPVFSKKNNGNFCGIFLSGIVEFDKDLNVVQQSAIQPALGLTERKLCYINDGTPVVAGNRYGSHDLFFAKLNSFYQTNCDSSITPVTTTTSQLNIFPSSFSFSLYNLAVVSHSYNVDTFSMAVTLKCRRNIELGNDTLMCNTSPLTLQNQFIEQFETFHWSTGETTPTISVNSTGKYWLYVTYNCEADTLSDTVNVIYANPIKTNLGTDIEECENQLHTFWAPSCNPCSYLWSTGSTTDTIKVNLPGSYWINVIDTNGCIFSDTVSIDFSKCECELYFPKAFTPNGDGLNDSFQPFYYCNLSDFNLKVFNRWGQQVYATKNPSDKWDGKHNALPAPSDIYYYKVTYTPVLKGKIDKPITRTGSVTVVY